MVMKRKSILLFSLVPVILACIALINLFTPGERERYDLFLAEQYSSVARELPDSPEMAALQDHYMTVDPELQRVPVERLYDAYLTARELQEQLAFKSGSEPIEWEETGSNMGGRTRAVMWDPNDAAGKKAWAGGVTGGLWYNDDVTSGLSMWQPVDDFWPNLSICCMTYDPVDPQTFYVGTGEPFTARVIYRESSGVGTGIWKSEDAGATWTLIPSTQDFKYISDIEVRDENGSSVIYAGVVSGSYHGINHQSQPSDGLYRSDDGGATWEQALPDINGSNKPYAPADIEIGPDGRIFVGTMKNLDMEGGATILWSDAGTAGSWTVFDDYIAIIEAQPEYNVPGRVILASAPSDASVVYALIGSGYISNSTGFNYARGGFILRSDDKGETWSETNQPEGGIDWASLSWHAFIAAVSPDNPDELYVGGLDVWKSANAGSSWSHLSDWSLMYWGGGPDYVHADQHAQVYKDGSPEEMLFGSDGGVFYTSNAGSGNPVFEEMNRNFSTLQFYTCDIYPLSTNDYFVGGLQDNGTLLYEGQPLDINDMIDGGDGAYCFFDEDEPQIMITSTYYNRYSIFVNFNQVDYNGDYSSGVFINPCDYDSPNNILYANAVTFGGSYSNNILRLEGFPYGTGGNGDFVNLGTGLNVYFSHVKVSPWAPPGTSTLFVGSQDGRLYKVTDAQATPVVTEIGSADFPVAYLSSVAIGGSEDTLVATFSNYGVPSVWQTYDGGDTWEDISGNLPDMPIRWALCHPQSAKHIMLATEVGIWLTEDGSAAGVTWEPTPDFPNVRVDMIQMRYDDYKVLAATHGRGLWSGIWLLGPQVGAEEIANNIPGLYPNPSDGMLYVPVEGSCRITVSDMTGKSVFDETDGEPGLTSLKTLDLNSLGSGIYILSVDDGEQIRSGRIILR